MPQPNPPRWATRFLNWYCREEVAEDLEGDLNEYFERNVKTKGVREARRIYVVDVFKFFRSYTIRKPRFVNLLIQWIMLGSYIKTSSRSIVRNKLFSSINIIGLAISMSVGLLLIAFLSDLVSYDSFHEKGSRIYRVNTKHGYLDREICDFASTSNKAGNLIREKITGVEDLTIIRNGFGGDAHIGDNVVPVQGIYADEHFLSVFTFPLLKGELKTALKEPYSIVLTEKSAKKLFGDTDAFGKPVRFDSIDYMVTAVLKDIPTFSHIQFESIVSFSTIELKAKDDKDFSGWLSIWQNYVYLVLPENTDLQNLQSSLDKLSSDENAAFEHEKNTLALQHLSDIALGPDLSNPIGPVMMVSVVWVVAGLAFIVILSACFNYTNLSIARALRRSREVGIRKVNGASKSHVLGQFIAEAVIIALLALVFSFGLFLILRPQFLSIAPEMASMVTLDLSIRVILGFVGLAITVGIVAGFLPALFFARINAVQVLKDVTSVKVFRHLNMRKALIVAQYTLSLAFITTTVIGYKQYRSFLTFDLGFSTENILNIRLEGNKGDALIKELSEIPEVNGISKSLMITSVGNYYGTNMKYNDPKDSVGVWYNSVDEHYLPLHGHKLLAGRNFSAKANKDSESEVIINEQTMKRFHIGDGDPSKAIGEIVTVDDKKLAIIGVLGDFHYGKVDSKIEPVAFRYHTEPNQGFVNAKISSTDLTATMDRIEKAWCKIDAVHPLAATFYDDQIEKAYGEFSAMLKILGFLAFLAVCIASMGLLGMVVFITETRLREISIRKVLGASEGNLIYLLSRGFIVLLTVSAMIAIPATYLFFTEVVLSNFPYSSPISMTDLFGGVFVVIIIAGIMIGSHTLRVARTNPARVLKSE